MEVPHALNGTMPSDPVHRSLLPLMLVIGAVGLLVLALVDTEPASPEVRPPSPRVSTVVADSLPGVRPSDLEAQR
ncbi:MAG TPA: hypothetical protein VGE21_04900 [Flavobacteriales bacterium]